MAVAADRRAGLGPLRRPLDELCRAADISSVSILVLTLVFLRAMPETDWDAGRFRYGLDIDRLLSSIRDLPYEGAREMEILRRAARDLPRHVLSFTIDALDSVADKLGNAATFRLLLEEFAEREGSRGMSVHTPESVTAILAGVIDLESASTIYDPFCRAGELLVAATAHARVPDPFVYGAMPDSRSLLIAWMNIRLHEVPGLLERRQIAELAEGPTGSRRFSRILTNPPFNLSHWAGHDSLFWRYGSPPRNNANFAWLQHATELLEPGGQAAVIMPNGASASVNPREQEIRMRMAEDGCVEALISLPAGLFYSSGIPVTIWLLRPPGSRRDEILFIDASGAGHMTGRTHRELDDAEIGGIIRTVDAWRSGRPAEEGISTISVSLSRIREHEYNLNPSVYLSRPPDTNDPETAISAISDLVLRLGAQHDEAAEKDARALRMLKGLMP